MAPITSTLLAVVALVGATTVAAYSGAGTIARSRSQFVQIPQDYAIGILAASLTNASECKSDYDLYLDAGAEDTWAQGHVHASNLASCIFSVLPQWKTTEFTSVSIILGLAPATLLAIGPDATEIAVLSLRRPLLATLLALGSPALRPGSDPVELLRVKPSLRPGSSPLGAVLGGASGKQRAVLAVVVALLEYALAGGAVVSVAYNVWELTYEAICWAGIQSWQTMYVPETAVVPLWALFALPVQVFFDFAIRLRVRHLSASPQRSDSRGGGRVARAWAAVRDRVAAETTPSAYAPPVRFRAAENGFVYAGCNEFVKLVSLTHVLMGTVVLSTIYFIDFRASIRLVSFFLTGALVCKAILRFELYSMQLQASECKEEEVGYYEYESVVLVQMVGHNGFMMDHFHLHEHVTPLLVTTVAQQ
ncbi:hypothetical protein GGR56DRAFT_679416 [Xylariaceae sp. FL0804]|nr:hypothetical protein GGR56DRAFT_679416 [Xylariaceae sp. FL0804]